MIVSRDTSPIVATTENATSPNHVHKTCVAIPSFFLHFFNLQSPTYQHCIKCVVSQTGWSYRCFIHLLLQLIYSSMYSIHSVSFPSQKILKRFLWLSLLPSLRSACPTILESHVSYNQLSFPCPGHILHYIPANDSLFSFPNSVSSISHCPLHSKWHLQRTKCPMSERTISRVYPRVSPLRLTDQNRCVWVVLLHRWVCARKEWSTLPMNISHWSPIVRHTDYIRLEQFPVSRCAREDLPSSVTGFAGLAKEEADFLECLGEGVFRRHRGRRDRLNL